MESNQGYDTFDSWNSLENKIKYIEDNGVGKPIKLEIALVSLM